MPLHPTLQRQLKRLGLSEAVMPSDASQWEELLQRLNNQYQGAEEERYMLERSLKVSSDEMQKLYSELQRHSESALAAEKNKLQAVLSSLSDSVIEIDIHGNMLYLNSAAAHALEPWQTQPIGQSLLDFIRVHVPFSQNVITSSDFTQWLSWGERLRDDNALLLLPDHAQVPISCVIGPILSDAKTTGYVAVFRDMRLQKLAEMELTQAKTLAEAAVKTKSDFLATMSHEIRTPLNGVIGMANLLKETPLNDEQNTYVGTLTRSAEILLSLINDILDFSKIEAGKLHLESASFSIAELVKDIRDIFQFQCEQKHLHYIEQLDDKLPTHVSGDINRLRQVLINLVGNAIKFTPVGSVTLSVQPEGDQADELHRIRFAVTDSGIGISEDAQKRLFQAFTQADSSTTRKFGGTGLGLSISKKLVGLMQGELAVSSELGKGSTFYFTISLGKVKEIPVISQITTSQTSDTAIIDRELHLLLVEDNKVNQMVATKLLQKFGYAYTLAENGEEALQRIAERDFDAILMDCQMPIMDGFEATRTIRLMESDSGKHIPIIGLTANAMEGDRERCLACGMDDYSTKPIKIEELKNKLHYWVTQNQPNQH